MNENIIYEYFPRPNSLKFYRKVSIAIVGSFFKLLSLRHNINFINGQQLFDRVLERDDKTPLLTIVNHASICDDTFIWGSILPFKLLADPYEMRWTLTAVDVCFTSKLSSYIFFGGQCIPVWRNVRCRETGNLLIPGLGVRQPSLEFSLDVMNRGGWLNIFPQGRIVYGFERMREESVRLRWGVGRLICDSAQKPLILPLWHCGLEEVCPVVKPYWRSAFKSNLKERKITIMVGDEIQLPEKLLNCPSCEESWASITEYIQERFYILRQRAIEAHNKFLLDK